MSAKPEDVQFRIVRDQEESGRSELDINTLLCQLLQSAQVLEATILYITKHGINVGQDGITSEVLLATSKKAVSQLFGNVYDLEGKLGISMDDKIVKNELY
ncbi:MAG: hypothetical protein OEZ68_21630 [Gammaproteobacteria bacterium]|nr:hypothetical protein [Gammaproteobacteria bacterium]MDH5803401.1 hypothetical protein [Gammaproteobacteria bacterium]